MSALGLLLLVQLGLTLGYLMTRGLVAARLPPRALLWAHRALLVLALAAPWLHPSSGAAWRPPAQVESSGPAGADLALRLASASAPLASVQLSPDLAALFPVLPALMLGYGVLRLLGDLHRLRGLAAQARPWRRIGRVRVGVLAGLPGPCAAALPGPCILVDPDSLLDPGRRRLVLRHELQHHRQGDPAWAWAWRLLRAGLGWNPALGAWARLAAELEELACDAAVLAHPRSSPQAYGRLLLMGATGRAALPLVAGLLGLGPPRSVPSTLHRRLHMLSSPPPPRPLRSVVLALAAASLLWTGTWAGRSLAGDPALSTKAFEDIVLSASEQGLELPAHPVIADRLAHLRGQGAAFYRRGLARRAEHRALVDGALRDAGLPAFLAAVPLVESGYSNWGAPGVAESQSQAPGTVPGRGLWMFIPSTARQYGLQVDLGAGLDERLDPELETQAAVALLSDLHLRYGDWGLALAAYNMGPRAVDAAIHEGGTRDPWDLTEAGLLNEYAASVVAAALLLSDPALLE